MSDSLILYIVLAGALVIVAVMMGRVMRRRPAQAQSVPGWISQKAEFFERGKEYGELRADFNYTDEKPATSRVTLTTFSLEGRQREVISEHMTERDFNQQRAKLRHEGWQEVHSTSDREGQSYYFQRTKR